jgi:protein-disulfide isomerase
MPSLSNIFRLQFVGLILAAGIQAANPSSSEIIIRIDDKSFTAADLHAKNPGATFQARNTLFEAERKAADELINEYLLEREAKKENVSVEQLLQRHAYTNIPQQPSEEALRFYYDGLDTAEPFEAVRHKIRDLIRDRRMAKAKTAYIQSLRNRSVVALRLAPPRAAIALGDAPVRGKAGAPVTIIEYADYECPYCQQIKPVVDRIEKEYHGKVVFAFKDVPLPNHANAQKAAEASHCAGAQGKYWEYHDRLFETKQFDLPNLKEHARSLGLNQQTFERCVDTGAQEQRVKAGIAEAQSIGLPGTPGFFVNGRFLSGAIDYETLRQVVEEELRAGASPGTETANARE